MTASSPPLAQQDAQTLLFHEARCLDQRRWDEWLALFEPDARFWVPAWRADHETVTNPRTEASLIFAEPRERIAERVRRVTLGQTPTTQPLPRTAHFVSNVQVLGAHGTRDEHRVSATWMVRRYDIPTYRDDVFYGHYDYVLRRTGDGLRIASKTVQLLNDRVATYIDFHCV
ncbi:2-halobenzoate 1,2-dioxygenase small subunit [Pigmentiphaga humi]|uniref:2-halobenzoate 1,2-dioxygenase small subunit n=1 Tax=Pigmentiphaga humi TaxID=2478468 RepID=A0A3P4B3M0_9BURK|nr:aromatic-ring-hydroxylating dioxygenase subunit beta [Pigmentiphaga humi]VCU70903.1 2-halobenzoate 1,2-dioxygenase small subunit [Pigmentiphaga humi]